jgi:DNA polymerase
MRNLPKYNPEAWEKFKNYCKQDVEVERAVKNKLHKFYKITDFERELWVLDQKINARGVNTDAVLISNALICDKEQTDELMELARDITGLSNPKSVSKAKEWLFNHSGEIIEKLNKDEIPNIIERLESGDAKKYLEIYSQLTKSSIAKYAAIERSRCKDGKVRGMLQFCGASRTSRWAGRLVQFQNLARNNLKTLDDAREILKNGDYEALKMIYDLPKNILSELVRTAFIPSKGNKFIVTDFSAIEARVIAWLANERWRLDVFNSHGKIYEASAAKMFKVPIESVGKKSEMRQKGKVSELSCGFNGGVGALQRMGASAMGLTDSEMQELINNWRKENPNIVALWRKVEDTAIAAIKNKEGYKINKDIVIGFKLGNLYVRLPSGRDLCYVGAALKEGNFGREAVYYKGVEQTTKQFKEIATYGGRLVENIVQSIARDCLAEALIRFEKAGYKTVMHIHDELILDVPADKDCIDEVNALMSAPIDWAKGLPLKGDSYETMYYKKD